MNKLKALLAVVVLALIIVFVLMNTHPVAINFLGVKIEAPASFVVLLSSLAGVALWPLLRAAMQLKKK